MAPNEPVKSTLRMPIFVTQDLIDDAVIKSTPWEQMVLHAKVVDKARQEITLSDGTVIPFDAVKDCEFTIETSEWDDGYMNLHEPIPGSERYSFNWQGIVISGQVRDLIIIENPRTLWGVTHV